MTLLLFVGRNFMVLLNLQPTLTNSQVSLNDSVDICPPYWPSGFTLVMASFVPALLILPPFEFICSCSILIRFFFLLGPFNLPEILSFPAFSALSVLQVSLSEQYRWLSQVYLKHVTGSQHYIRTNRMKNNYKIGLASQTVIDNVGSHYNRVGITYFLIDRFYGRSLALCIR